MSLPKCLVGIILLAAAGCKPAVQSSNVSYEFTNVTQSAGQTPAIVHPKEVAYVGRNSCSATACHGQPQTTPISWRNAHQIFEATDPHRRAFDVLYTERSVRMYRLLTEDESKAIDDKVYLQFLEQKCIGCHATPPQGSQLRGPLGHQPSPETYWQGVSCESCHGPASHWLGTHYSKNWPENGAFRAMQSATGFQDTRTFDQRAAICVQCHHGPQQIGDQVFDVNHDLIAAGHPRLKFELHAYLANLPRHWKAEVNHGQSDSLHFNTWRAGQTALIGQDKRLQETRAAKSKDSDLSGWAEFANHDCRHCHHVPAEPAFRLTLAPPMKQPDLFENVPFAPTKAVRAAVLLKFLEQSRKPQSPSLHPSSDQAVDIYLAAAAFAHDFPKEPPFADLARLETLLARQAGKTQYDLPGDFNPEEPELKQALNDLQQALEQLTQP